MLPGKSSVLSKHSLIGWPGLNGCHSQDPPPQLGLSVLTDTLPGGGNVLSIPSLKCPGYFRTGVDPDRKSLLSRLPDALAHPQSGTGSLAEM